LIQFIAFNGVRMERGQRIRLNRDRQDDPRGGRLEALEPVSEGKLQLLRVTGTLSQTEARVGEVLELKIL